MLPGRISEIGVITGAVSGLVARSVRWLKVCTEFWFQNDFGLIVLLKEVEMAKAKNAVPEGFHTVTPQLTLDNAAPAIEWYKKALGAEEVARAVAAGAKVLDGPMGAMQDQFWGDRSGTFDDPYGYRWSIATRKEDLSPQEMEQRQQEWMKKFAPQPVHS